MKYRTIFQILFLVLITINSFAQETLVLDLTKENISKDIKINYPISFNNNVYFYYDNLGIITDFSKEFQGQMTLGGRQSTYPNSMTEPDKWSALWEPEYYYSLDNVFKLMKYPIINLDIQNMLTMSSNDLLVVFSFWDVNNSIIPLSVKEHKTLRKENKNYYDHANNFKLTIYNGTGIKIKDYLIHGNYYEALFPNWRMRKDARISTCKFVISEVMNKFFIEYKTEKLSTEKDKALPYNNFIYNFLKQKSSEMDSISNICDRRGITYGEYKDFGIEKTDNREFWKFPHCHNTSVQLRKSSARIMFEIITLINGNDEAKSFKVAFNKSENENNTLWAQTKDEWQADRLNNVISAIKLTTLIIEESNKLKEEDKLQNGISPNNTLNKKSLSNQETNNQNGTGSLYHKSNSQNSSTSLEQEINSQNFKASLKDENNSINRKASSEQTNSFTDDSPLGQSSDVGFKNEHLQWSEWKTSNYTGILYRIAYDYYNEESVKSNHPAHEWCIEIKNYYQITVGISWALGDFGQPLKNIKDIRRVSYLRKGEVKHATMHHTNTPKNGQISVYLFNLKDNNGNILEGSKLPLQK